MSEPTPEELVEYWKALWQKVSLNVFDLQSTIQSLTVDLREANRLIDNISRGPTEQARRNLELQSTVDTLRAALETAQRRLVNYLRAFPVPNVPHLTEEPFGQDPTP